MALTPISQLPPEFFMALGGGILSGNGVNDGVGRGLTNATTVLAAEREKAEEAQKQGATYNALMKLDPQKAELFKSGVLSGTQAFELFSAEKRARDEASRPKYDWKVIDGKLVRVNTNDQMADADPVQVMGDYSEPKLPAIGEEFEYAKQQGFKGTLQDYQAYKAGLNKSGLMIEQGPDGFRVVQGDLKSAPKKLSEWQSKDLGWLNRGDGANKELQPLENALTSLPENTASKIPLGNYLKTPEYQQAERAGREFLAVVLRKDTGAAVTEAEMAYYAPMYLPQPGDKPEVIQMKREARQRFLDALKTSLGDVVPDEKAEDATSTEKPATPPAGKTEIIVNGKKATIEQVDE